jgi:hypothetical protein
MYDRLRRKRENVLYYPNSVVYHCSEEERFTAQYVRRWRFRLEERQFSHEHDSLDRQAFAFWALPRWKY